MDNAWIHHGDKIAELCDRFGGILNSTLLPFLNLYMLAGVKIEYLPPYSPDLNPIEEAFSKIKHYLWHHHNYYFATTWNGILYDMYEIMDIITSEDTKTYYMHAGYF